jgi:hypothetical protein
MGDKSLWGPPGEVVDSGELPVTYPGMPRAAALASMVVLLPVFWSMGQLHTWRNPPLDAMVFAVVLAVGLPRAIASLGPPDLVRAAGALLLGAAT